MPCKKLGTGWRVIAIFNIIAVFLITLFGTILVIVGTQQSAGSGQKSGGISAQFIFFEGDCKTSKSINTWLHLLLNAFSTGVLASSNFFMQILSSPTRSEVDKAHKANRALKIGVQSLRNVFWTSKIKFVCWILFFISSFPLHLFFNSAIFSTEYLGTDWDLTIASEGFVQGANFRGSGAALWPPRFGDKVSGYGSPGNLDDYFNSSSNTFEKIQNASREAKHWKKLGVSDCVSQYVDCNPRIGFRDVVMVVESQNKSFMAKDSALGWTRDKLLLPFKSDKEKSYWNQRMPLEETNSLWFAADCKTSVSPKQSRAGGCSQTCGKAVGTGNITSYSRRPGEVPTTYTLSFFTNTSMDASWPGLANNATRDLTLKYCLAKPVLQNCKVGISNQLLLIVVVSIAVKGFLAVAVLFILPNEKPLAVLGDAIESFIQFPDDSTVDRCLLDRDVEEYEGVGHACAMTAPPLRQNWTSAIQRETWTRSYGVLYLNILLLAAGFIAAQMNTPITGSSFTKSMSNGILSAAEASTTKIIDFVLRANLPQLLLSITYFIYNNMFTYLCTEKEWNSYGGVFKPLRVSQPKGQQQSTYRLQLPYRYSIPLMIVSTLMHWLVSNAIYVFVAEGDYYELRQLTTKSSSLNTDDLGTGLSKDAYVGVGYSTPTILVLLIATIILPVIPTLLRHRKVKTSMPLSGASSAVISAACHIPIPENNIGFQLQEITLQSDQSVAVETSEDAICLASDRQELDERQELLQSADNSGWGIKPGLSGDLTHPEDGPTLDGESFLREIALGPVRWGVVKTPASWKEKHTNLSNPSDIVEHLSFGSELHEVTDPIPGHWYT
ncbi:unnamed protein product [Fusarium graminearum]|uniref:DUF6536 domain-containing protein n=1 Tax=Gibberella zeae TaxID=5518 RepID=A0A9N8NNF4_GIBZA|nr:unnamed protein product [Fusarium graminearum]